MLKLVYLAIQNGVHITTFGSCTVILDQPIWLQCVGADLAAESNILLAVIIGLSCGLPFLQFKIVQSGAQDSQAVSLL